MPTTEINCFACQIRWTRFSLTCYVEKTSDGTAKASILFIYVRIKDACLPMKWNHIIVGNGGWNQSAEAFTQHDLITCFTHTNQAISLDEHADVETVIFDEV